LLERRLLLVSVVGPSLLLVDCELQKRARGGSRRSGGQLRGGRRSPRWPAQDL
jgi:hypothetical protein